VPFALPGYPLLRHCPSLVFGVLAFSWFRCCVLAFDQPASLAWPVGWRAFCWPGPAGLVVPGAPGGRGCSRRCCCCAWVLGS